jgi:hypothetical protein
MLRLRWSRGCTHFVRRDIRHVSRNVCANRNLRGVLACERTRGPRPITWLKQSDRIVSVRQNSMLNIPNALVTSRELTWCQDSVSPAFKVHCIFRECAAWRRVTWHEDQNVIWALLSKCLSFIIYLKCSKRPSTLTKLFSYVRLLCHEGNFMCCCCW